MKKSFLIAWVSVIELMREKFFLLTLFFGFGVIGLSLVLGNLTISEHDRILGDFGLAAVELAAMVICVFLGSFLLSKEVDRQTCLLVLARPVTRFQFIIGKLCSVMILNTFTILVMSLLILGLLGNWSLWTNAAILMFSVWCKSLVVLFIVVLLSLLVRPVLAAFSGFSIYLLAHWIPDLMFFANKSKNDQYIMMSKAVDWIVPNFYSYNWKSYQFLESGVRQANVNWMLLNVLSWVLMTGFFINVVFGRKDIV